MAKAWMKSLQCKSRALDDVVLFQPKQKHHNHNRQHHHHPIIPNSASCRKSFESLRDVVETAKPRRKPKSPPESPLPPPRPPPPTTNAARVKTKRSISTISEPFSGARGAPSNSSLISRFSAEPFVPALTELPEGHPSRNVVEIIFQTSWSLSPSPKEFSGRIEMVFKVQNLPRTVTRFEEYREAVKSRAAAAEDSKAGLGEDGARCVADGNEVMRFYCLGPTSGAYEASGCAWAFGGGKGAAICTFAGSGGAHESAGGGRGRRAMLVCRVIAGRVCKQLGLGSFGEAKGRGGGRGYDSVSGENSELLVFDSHAVLPCFLIIYKL